jgi:hypothetical protein
MSILPSYHPSVPLNSNDEKLHRRQIASTVNNMMQGHINCTLTITLNASATSTIVSDARIGATSAIIPAMATTLDGATAIKNGIYVANIMTGSATINHVSNSAIDQTITLIIIG